MEKTTPLHVEIWSDIVCPFCYIGYTNFLLALEQFEHADKVSWTFKSFQLDPYFKQDKNQKHDVTAALAKKYNRSIDDIVAMQLNITQMGKSAGVHFDFDTAITFNTLEAHRVLQKAKERNLENKLEEAFFVAYFTEGKDLGNLQVLEAVAESAGLTTGEIGEALSDPKYEQKVLRDIQEAAQFQISGVPFFVLNKKYGVSGAQPIETFLNTLREAYADWQGNSPLQMPKNSLGASCDTDGRCD